LPLTPPLGATRKILVVLCLACNTVHVLPPEKEKLLPPKGKTVVMPNAAANSEHLDVFRRVTGYTPPGHKFWMNLDDPDYVELHERMEPYNASLMITLLFGRETKGKELAPQGKKLTSVTSGRYNAALDKLGNELRAFGKPVYLDTGNEAEFFYPGHARDFVMDYRYVHYRLKPLCGDNVLFFWHTVTDVGFAPRPMDWYPGDEFVDGIGLSLYNDTQFRSAETFIVYAKQWKMPVAVFEIGLAPHKASRETGGRVSDYTWNGYYRRIFDFVERYDIPLLGYAGFGDEVFTKSGPFHHNRIDYLARDIQDGWVEMLKRPRYTWPQSD
jgi:hypothetical protein